MMRPFTTVSSAAIPFLEADVDTDRWRRYRYRRRRISNVARYFFFLPAFLAFFLAGFFLAMLQLIKISARLHSLFSTGAIGERREVAEINRGVRG